MAQTKTGQIVVKATDPQGAVVSGATIKVNPQTQELSDVMSTTQIRELPTLTRNPYDLVGLSGNVYVRRCAEITSGFVEGFREGRRNVQLAAKFIF